MNPAGIRANFSILRKCKRSDHKLKYRAFILFALLLFTSCEEDTTGIQTEKNYLPYFPIGDGYIWTYEVTRKVTMKDTPGTITYVDTITCEMTLSGVTYQDKDLYSYKQPGTASFALYSVNDTLYSLAWAGSPDPPQLFWKKYFELNETWEVDGLSSGPLGFQSAPNPKVQITIDNKLIDRSASIRIGDRIFLDCIVVQSRYAHMVSQFDFSLYYARNTGVVYITGSSESIYSDIDYEYKLLSFEKL